MQAAHKTVDWKSSRIHKALESYLLQGLLDNAETGQTLSGCPYFLKVTLLELVLHCNLKGVVVIPGSFFGEMGADHVRMTFVSEPEERIELGVKQIAEYVSSSTVSTER